MKRIMKTLLVFALAVAMLAMSACGTNGDNGQASDQSAGTSENYNLVLGTAGTTGTYYVVGAAMANAVTQSDPNEKVVAQATNGGVENLNLLMSGDIQLGFTNSDGAYWASQGGGTGYYKDYAQPGDIQGVMRLYESEGHMITTADSDINTYADLKGKTVCLGPTGSTICAMSIAILEAYGIDAEKDIKPVYYSIQEGLEKLNDGVIDATFFVASAPTSGLTEASATHSLKFVDADPAVLDKVVQEYPYYVATTTKEGAYPSMNSVNTLKIYTEIVTSSKVPDDAVYQFVKYAIEELPTYVDAHISCQEISADSACITGAPLAPGAEKYYKEIGVLK